LKTRRFELQGGFALTEALVASLILGFTFVAALQSTRLSINSYGDSVKSQISQNQVFNYIENTGSQGFESCDDVLLRGQTNNVEPQTGELQQSTFSLDCAATTVSGTVGNKTITIDRFPKQATVYLTETGGQWSIGLSE